MFYSDTDEVIVAHNRTHSTSVEAVSRAYTSQDDGYTLGDLCGFEQVITEITTDTNVHHHQAAVPTTDETEHVIQTGDEGESQDDSELTSLPSLTPIEEHGENDRNEAAMGDHADNRQLASAPVNNDVTGSDVDDPQLHRRPRLPRLVAVIGEVSTESDGDQAVADAETLEMTVPSHCALMREPNSNMDEVKRSSRLHLSGSSTEENSTEDERRGVQQRTRLRGPGLSARRLPDQVPLVNEGELPDAGHGAFQLIFEKLARESPTHNAASNPLPKPRGLFLPNSSSQSSFKTQSVKADVNVSTSAAVDDESSSDIDLTLEMPHLISTFSQNHVSNGDSATAGQTVNSSTSTSLFLTAQSYCDVPTALTQSAYDSDVDPSLPASVVEATRREALDERFEQRVEAFPVLAAAEHTDASASQTDTDSHYYTDDASIPDFKALRCRRRGACESSDDCRSMTVNVHSSPEDVEPLQASRLDSGPCPSGWHRNSLYQGSSGVSNSLIAPGEDFQQLAEVDMPRGD